MTKRPFLGWFVSPAGLVALGLTAAMAAVFQFSMRAYIPGSLEVGGFTLQNFAAIHDQFLQPDAARIERHEFDKAEA